MAIPTLFLDDASCHPQQIDRHQAEECATRLIDVIKSIKRLNKSFVLNTCRPIAQYCIAANWTLQSILGGGRFKEEWDFLRFLNQKSPYSEGLEPSLGDSILNEVLTLRNRIKSEALLCALIIDSAIISFDAQDEWRTPLVKALHITLLEDGNLVENECGIRNFCELEHVLYHKDWLSGFCATDAAVLDELWENREELFPSLRFLRTVRRDLEKLSANNVAFTQAVNVLNQLSKDAVDGKPFNAKPEFSILTTKEFEQRRLLCWWLDDETGCKLLFDWHSRFTGGMPGRVHFRIDCVDRRLVIAYIGSKLDS